ncbi:MAG: hypothetical protein WCE32_08850 [Pseudolabrys sp.]
MVMTPASAKRRDEFLALMARYDELGRLLPADFDARDADDGELAGVELVFAELDRVRAAMKAVLVDEAWANALGRGASARKIEVAPRPASPGT